MQEKRARFHILGILLELSPGLAHFIPEDSPEGRALRTELSGYLDELLTCLGIEADFLLHVKSGEQKGVSGGNGYNLFIDGAACRLAVSVNIAADASAHDMAVHVAHAAYGNRELLVTDGLSRAVLEDWSREDGRFHDAECHEEGFRACLAELVRRGFSINRLKRAGHLLEGFDRGAWDALSCCEAVVSELDAPVIKVHIGRETVRQSPGDDQPLEELCLLLQEGTFYDLGIIIPAIENELDQNLGHEEFRLQLNDLKFPPLQGLNDDEFLVNETVDRLSLLGMNGRKAFNPVDGREYARAKNEGEALKTCKSAGLTVWGNAGYVILHLSSMIRQAPDVCLMTGTVRYYLETLRPYLPTLVDACLARFGLERLTWILRMLLEEHISVRGLSGILESLLSVNGTSDVDLDKYIVFFPNAGTLCPVNPGRDLEHLDATDYASVVRMSLKNLISHKYGRGSNTLAVYLLDPAVEKRIQQAYDDPLTDDRRAQLIEAIRIEVGYAPAMTQPPVILTTFLVRKQLWRLINKEFPHVAVISYQELSPYMNIQPIARISWE